MGKGHLVWFGMVRFGFEWYGAWVLSEMFRPCIFGNPSCDWSEIWWHGNLVI